MKKVIITGILDTRNNGCWAMADTVISALIEKYPGISIVFLTHKMSVDSKRLLREGVTIIVMPWTKINLSKIRTVYFYFCTIVILLNLLLFKLLKLNLFYRSFCREIQEADLQVDLSGDSISAGYGLSSVLVSIFPLLCRYLLKKPYFVCAQSIGPFAPHWAYRLAGYVLSKADVLTGRECITERFLKDQRIDQGQMALTADMAFLLQVPAKEHTGALCAEAGVVSGKKYVGVSISGLISQYSSLGDEKMTRQIYVKKMAAVCDKILMTHAVDIVFVPHVMIPGNDDRIISREVKNIMRFSSRVLVLEKEYTGAELKAFIGCCEAFLASRMHAAISAVSQHIPTVIVAYNHKTYGIFGEMLGLQQQIIDIKEIMKEDFVEKCFLMIDVILKDGPSAKVRMAQALERANVFSQARKNITLCEPFLTGGVS